MGLNLSNKQIAKELDLSVEGVQKMTTRLREGVTERESQTILREEVECDEVCITAGHKGNPEAVERKGRRNRLKGARGRGTPEKEKPPVMGMIQRGGEVVIQMLADRPSSL